MSKHFCDQWCLFCLPVCSFLHLYVILKVLAGVPTRRDFFDCASCCSQARVEPPGGHGTETKQRGENKSKVSRELADPQSLGGCWEGAIKRNKGLRGVGYPAEEHRVGLSADWWRLQPTRHREVCLTSTPAYFLVPSFLDLQTPPIIS